MPIIEGNAKEIHVQLGPQWEAKVREYNKLDSKAEVGDKEREAAFEHLCFEFGIELDEVTSEYEQIKAEKGEDAAKEANADTSILYKVEIPANRYDLLCLEGLLRALRIYLDFEKSIVYRTVLPENKADQITLRVTNSTKQIRKYVVAAVLRNVKFTEASYNSFIKLQEKLHFNICRRRTLVAIGTHDLDTLQPPFLYDARAPQDISFTALRETENMTAAQLFEAYRSRDVCPLKPYLPIIENSPVYPVIYDSKDVVLSLPPVINGEHSKITLKTRNVFIESTATDLTKARIVINTICAMFSEYCAKPFEVEQVKVVYDEPVVAGDGTELSSYMSPDFTPISFKTTCSYINRGLGTKLCRDEIIKLLSKMSLDASEGESTGDEKDDGIVVLPPITRSDILHEVDIMEDVAIAFGYNNIERRLPARATTGAQQVINSLSDKLRVCVANAGYCEVLNWALISKDDNYKNMRIPDEDFAVEIGNPKTKEFEICRTNLLPGVLRTLSENVGHCPLPLRLFEVGDVVLRDENHVVKARNERRLAAVVCGTQDSGLEQIHGLLDRLMLQNEISFLPQVELRGEKFGGQWPKYDPMSKDKNCRKRYYTLIESDRPTFFPKRQAGIIVDGKVAGYFGMLHPEVAGNFGVMKNDNILVSAMELTCHMWL